MNIAAYRNRQDREIAQLKSESQMVEWLRDRMFSNENRRWFLQPYTLLGIRNALGNGALSIAQDYLDDEMFKLRDYSILNEKERTVLGPKMQSDAKFVRYFMHYFYSYGTLTDDTRTLIQIWENLQYEERSHGLVRNRVVPVSPRGYQVVYNPSTRTRNNTINDPPQRLVLNRGAGENLSLTDLDWLETLQ